MNGGAQAKDPLLQKYLKLVMGRMEEFKAFKINHRPRKESTRVDDLSRLASIRSLIIIHFFVKEIRRKKTQHRNKEEINSISERHNSTLLNDLDSAVYRVWNPSD